MKQMRLQYVCKENKVHFNASYYYGVEFEKKQENRKKAKHSFLFLVDGKSYR